MSADDHLIEINRVAAKVNNEIVTWGEIDRAMTSLNFTNSEKKERAPEFVDGKVDRLLSIYAFNDKGMAIPDSYIEQEYNKRLIQEFNGDRRLFRDVLRSKGMSQMEYRDSIREEIIYQHMMATRLWQNTAKVHFDTSARPNGSRLIYGGHVISMARALSFNGLANAQMIVGLNGGAHANPCLSGDTIRTWTEVLDKADTDKPGVGALRLRLVATKGGEPFKLKGEDGKYLPDVLLDLDYWALIPK